MVGARPVSAEPRHRQGFWLTVGEVVGVLALIFTALNFWESHQQHLEESRRATREASASAAFVAIGQAERDGRSLPIAPLASGQAILTQRYVFPSDIASAHEVSASRPRIQLDWVVAGLRAYLQTGHVKGSGEAHLPVLIETTYVEAGEQQTDRALYRLGYSWRPRFLGGEQVRLEGLALERRAVSGDAQHVLGERWSAERRQSPR